MKRLWFAALMLCVSCTPVTTKGLLDIHGTTPVTRSPSCVTPERIPMAPGTMMKIHATWDGPESGRDSVLAEAGTPFSIARYVPVGQYTVRGWAVDLRGHVGCDTTIFVVVRG